MIIENLVVLLASCGGIGFFALLLCRFSSRISTRHSSYRWWFWRLGLIPVAASAFAVYIRLTPREQVEGSSVNYGRLDSFAIMSWGFILPLFYLMIAVFVLLILSFRRGDKE